MNPLLLNRKLDLVDFGDVRLLMFRDDYVYSSTVPDEFKNLDLREHYVEVQRQGHRPSLVTPENIDSIQSTRYGVFLYLQHHWEHDLDLTILDIGSHVGDFAIRMGNFIRTFGRKTSVISFDPSEAGALVEYNIAINGLEDIVRHENLAVSDMNGLRIFHSRARQSHSSSVFVVPSAPPSLQSKFNKFLHDPNKVRYFRRIGTILRNQLADWLLQQADPGDSDYVVTSVNILDYLTEHHITGNLLVKIDTEGLDAVIVETLTSRMATDLISFIIEFNPLHFSPHEQGLEFLRSLSKDFVMYDLYYCPNPSRFSPVREDSIDSFYDDVCKTRPYFYTDILLIPRRLPGLEQLTERLDKLQPGDDTYLLVPPSGTN